MREGLCLACSDQVCLFGIFAQGYHDRMHIVNGEFDVV